MPQYIAQEINEKRFNRRHIDGYIRDEIQANAEMQAKISHGVQLIEEFIQKDYYASKNKRVAQLVSLDFEALVKDIFVGVAYCQTEELFTSVTAQMASRLRFSDKAEAITTVAELMAVLCQTDAFDINKANKMSSLVIQSRIPLSDKLVGFIVNSQYLPPMVCEPEKLVSNFSSGYLTHNDSLILGQGNHHDGDICLDVLNSMNKVALSLDLEFLCKVEEEPTSPLTSQDQFDYWKDFKRQSYAFYDLMQSQGNVFYLTHKVDKRGRIYAQGYHITTQGSAFKKAMIELATMEYVTGVPT
jgi:hypothetical protein